MDVPVTELMDAIDPRPAKWLDFRGAAGRSIGASLFSPLFLLRASCPAPCGSAELFKTDPISFVDEQKKGLARMQERLYEVPSVDACETITRHN